MPWRVSAINQPPSCNVLTGTTGTKPMDRSSGGVDKTFMEQVHLAEELCEIAQHNSLSSNIISPSTPSTETWHHHSDFMSFNSAVCGGAVSSPEEEDGIPPLLFREKEETFSKSSAENKEKAKHETMMTSSLQKFSSVLNDEEDWSSSSSESDDTDERIIKYGDCIISVCPFSMDETDH